MEQELAEATKLREEDRQQWVEQTSKAEAELAAVQASLESLGKEKMMAETEQSELVSLRESEHISQQALQKEKMEVARLETELALMTESNAAAAQVRLDASERDRAEIAQLESQLASMREAAVQANKDALEREGSEVNRLERELASLKDKQEGAQKNDEILAAIWRHLHSLALEGVRLEEEIPVPADLSLLLDTVQSIDAELKRLKVECCEREERCAQLTHTKETLQGKRKHLMIYGIRCVYLIQVLIVSDF